MPRLVVRQRKRQIFEVDQAIIPILIEHGARIVAFQKFIGGGNQSYMTLLAGPHAHFITYHTKPFPFIIQAGGNIIPDKQ